MTPEEKAHARHIALREKRVSEAFEGAIAWASALTERVKHLMGADPWEAEAFTFDRYPQLRNEVEWVIEWLHEALEANLSEAVHVAWQNAELDNDKLLKAWMGDHISKISKDRVEQFFGRSDEARRAFIKRKDGRGLNLSQRVWNITEQYKQELEMGLDIGILEGRSASEMAAQLKRYLNNPTALFRRVRDERGALHLSKRAKAYHPGQGVYRSAYKNARRLTATETNIAYRTADYERWKRMDFVQGIEVRLSNNHTLNGVPFTDICDELKGRYPKDFKFTGWHPHCRCYAVPILQDLDDFLEQEQKYIDTGELPDYSSGEVKRLPKVFTEWARDNKKRIARASQGGSVPYFLSDNFKVGNDGTLMRLGKKPSTFEHARKKEVGKKLLDAEKNANIKEVPLKKYENASDVADEINRIGADWMTTNENIESVEAKEHLLKQLIKQHGDTEGRKVYERLVKEKVPFKLKTTSIRGVNGATDRRGNIYLTEKNMEAVKEAMRGINKIARGGTFEFTDAQNNAMATLWHEIWHNRNLENVFAGKRTKIQKKYMELANEFVARKTMPDFYNKLGLGYVPDVKLMGFRESTGYNRMVFSYDYTIDALKLNRAKVESGVMNHLINGSYSDQKTGLSNALIDGGLDKIWKKDALTGKVIEKKATESDIDSLLDYITSDKRKGKGKDEMIKGMDRALKKLGFIKPK